MYSDPLMERMPMKSIEYAAMLVLVAALMISVRATRVKRASVAGFLPISVIRAAAV
jgi:hypothetical protein